MISFVLYLYVFAVGASVGSFLHVVALRWPKGESFVRGRSHCVRCGAVLTGRDLVPICSFFFLRGRCRHCGAAISLRYPLVEAVLGMAFLLSFWWNGFTLAAANDCLLAALLLLVFLIDLDTMTIPNGLVLLFLLPIAADLWLSGLGGVAGRVAGALGVGLPFLLLIRFLPGSFGGGDVKLLAVTGFLLGYQAILIAVFLAVMAAGLLASALLMTRRLQKGDHIPFGPFLAVAIFLARLFAAELFSLYLDLWL